MNVLKIGIAIALAIFLSACANGPKISYGDAFKNYANLFFKFFGRKDL